MSLQMFHARSTDALLSNRATIQESTLAWREVRGDVEDDGKMTQPPQLLLQ